MTHYTRSNKKFYTRVLSLVILGGIGVAVLLAAANDYRDASAKDERSATGPGMEAPVPAVRVEEVSLLSNSHPKPITGFVEPKETVYLMPRISGYLKKVAFQEGDIVHKDDLLFEIEDTIYQINVKAAESVVKQIKAEIELAKITRDRAVRLYEKNVIAQQELDEATRGTMLQEAKLEEAEAKLEQAQTDLSYTKIYAPLTGRIGKKQFSEGNYITPNSGQLASIVQVDPVTVRFSITESEFIRLLQDSSGGVHSANIELLRANYEPVNCEFKIDFVDNLVYQRTGSIMVYLLCENPGQRLMPGGFAQILISERFKNPLPSINVSAIMRDGEKSYVYVLNAENQVEVREVTIGIQVLDKRTILEGLSPGEHVIVGGLNKVTPGGKVTPIFEKTPSMIAEDHPVTEKITMKR